MENKKNKTGFSLKETICIIAAIMAYTQVGIWLHDNISEWMIFPYFGLTLGVFGYWYITKFEDDGCNK